ncbi:MAG TPA: cell division protein FtsZ [Solirubrobacteraceae bacterium]|nr:cell division protein FtsZ [Solirubrobacteraceae bacterium]
MREGPLTALFRKTEEDAQADEGQQQLPDAEAEPAAPSAPQPERQQRAQETPAPAPEENVDVKPAAVRAESKPAAPKARAQEPDEESAHIPTPRERLRNVFSAEIPANMMERAGAGETPAREESPAETGAQTAAARAARAAQEERIPSPEGPPAMDVYAREDRSEIGQRAFGQAGPVIHPVIRVVGVGGAGVNAVNRMVEAEVEGVEFLAINTDLQSLQQSTADITLHIGAELTRGLGSGSDTNLGRAAAMEDYDRAKALLKGSDMVFITAGAGGGTGTGAAPIVARIAREVGALTVAIVTKPFGFEGSKRAEQADAGVDALAEEVDTLIVVPNNRLLSVLDKQTSMVEAFRVADDVLRQGVQGISDLVTLPGLINLDFADVRTIMSGAGSALLGIGMGAGGEHRATEAAMQAVASPLLETSMEGARSILLSITGGKDLSLWEVNEAAKAVSEAAHPDANIIFGAMVDEKLEEQVWVTVVATGYEPKRGARTSGRGRLEEPAGEPRVQRAGPSSGGRRERDRRGGLGVGELDVPEFMPRV